ncbi:MAG: nicotinamide-nucleotide amidase [Thermotogota bacterium]|nr:nicotinamide-nucleotide amidase [Thermotogota bacterium]MDK2864107.1 nicotinamide-nucleotide amidase [Thermotogota bacterium]
MKAWIITTGNEILDGVVKNTNADFLIERLNEKGLQVEGLRVVRDEEKAIMDAIQTALAVSDVVVISGGLGSTDDDITRESVAAFIKRRLYIDRSFADRVFERYHKRFGERVPQGIEKFAMMIEGAKVYFSENALVPAQVVEYNDKLIILLPGPPNELAPLFEKVFSEHPKLSQLTSLYTTKTFRFAGVPESLIEESLKDVLKDVEYSTTLDYYVGPTIRVKVNRENGRMLTSIERVIRERFPVDFIGTDEETLERITVRLLKEKNLTLSLAESCTGGSVSAILVKVEGLSHVYKGAVVSYNRKVKESLLGIDPELIDVHDVVSEPVAAEMAQRVREILNSDIGASVTGVAGPEKGDSNKDVGTVCFAVADAEGCQTFTDNIRGDRFTIVKRASYRLIDLIRRHVLLGIGKGG